VTLWILDTNVINQLHGYAPNIEKRLAGVNPSDVAITIITAEELISGWFNEINKANNPEALNDRKKLEKSASNLIN